MAIKAKASITLARVNDGAAGKGVKSTSITYQAWKDGTTTPTGVWSSTPPKTTAENPYLWTRTITTYTDGATSTAYAIGATPEGLKEEIDKAQSDSAAANHNSVQAQEAAKEAANTADQANKLANSNKAWLQDWSFSGAATIDGGKIQAKTVTAEQLNVKELAALSADLGVVTAGVIQSADGNLKLDLNSSDGLRIKSANKSTELIADGAGTRVVDSAGNKVAEFTSSGTETKQIKVSGKSELSGILIEPVGDEIWISRVI